MTIDLCMYRYIYWAFVVGTLSFFSSVVLATPGSFYLQGQIVKPDLMPLEGANVEFTIQILSPGRGRVCSFRRELHLSICKTPMACFLFQWEREHVIGLDFEDTSSLVTILSNTAGPWTPDNCGGVNSYSPSLTDDRRVKIVFDDGTGPVEVDQDHRIKSHTLRYGGGIIGRFGRYGSFCKSTHLQQLSAKRILKLFLQQEVMPPNFVTLIDGNSSQYMVTSPSAPVDFNSQRITGVGTPSVGDDATNKTYVDSQIAGNTSSVGTLGAGNANEILSWDGTQWVMTNVNALDTGTLPISGGTMTGNLNMGNNDITNINNVGINNDLTVGNNVTITGGIGVTTGVNSAGNIAAQGESEVRFEDNTGGEYVGFKAPATVTGSYTMELPPAVGTTNQVLKLNASGNLIWADDNNDINSVFGRTGAVVAASGDYDANQVDNAPAGGIAATDVQGAINELDSEKVAKAGDSMTGDLNLESAFRTQATRRCPEENMLVLRAPLGVTSYTLNLPNADGSLNQVLKHDGAGGLVWATDEDNDAVASVFGRTGAVIAASGDYDANQVDNAPAGRHFSDGCSGSH